MRTMIKDALAAVGSTGSVHVRALDGPGDVELCADEPVVLASTMKVPVALEFARQAASGDLDPRERVRVTAADRHTAWTGFGVGATVDDVEMSLRDIATSMIMVSDNVATDVVMRRVGIDRINATMRELGLDRTVLRYDIGEGLSRLAEALGHETLPEGDELRAIGRERLEATLHGTSAHSSTPREMSRLLELIWRDEAGPPEACAEVRRSMSMQVWPHRIVSGFGEGVEVAGKTGSTYGVRNEVAVITYPDGARYAAAIYTRHDPFVDRDIRLDLVLGTVARIAVEELRGA